MLLKKCLSGSPLGRRCEAPGSLHEDQIVACVKKTIGGALVFDQKREDGRRQRLRSCLTTDGGRDHLNERAAIPSTVLPSQ